MSVRIDVIVLSLSAKRKLFIRNDGNEESIASVNMMYDVEFQCNGR